MTTTLAPEAPYDVVGQYVQDKINGFTDRLLDRLLDLADLRSAASILDAMGGDGNLTLRLHQYCNQRGLKFPDVTMMEISRVQAEFARMNLARLSAKILQGDVLAMTLAEGGERIPDGSFDRILIKSGTHEIPLERQSELYASLFRVLKPGGLFVNLGFLYDDPEERDDFRELTRFKDTFAGMTRAAADRHFLTRDEFYSRLEQVGFADIRCGAHFDYTIHSSAVVEQYFKGAENALSEIHARQAKAMVLRRKGRIRFDYDHSVLTAPGEITVARKPTLSESNTHLFRQYPMDFLRGVEAHSTVMTAAARQIPNGARVIDLGCGIGLLAERLLYKNVAYRGFDIVPDFIDICHERYGTQPGWSFDAADINTVDLGTETADTVALISTVNLAEVDTIRVLRKSLDALRPGGRIIVAGPTSAHSFALAEPRILMQLDRDGLIRGNESQIQALREANARLLTDRGHYWSVEGMIALLKELGFKRAASVDTEMFYGYGYMVVAEK